MSIILAVGFFAVPIAIAILIVVAISKGNKKNPEDTETFSDIIRTMYIYLIMILFLCIVIASTIAVFNSLLEVLLPTSTDTYTKNTNAVDLITNLTLFFVSVPVFTYYSSLARKESKKVTKSIEVK